MTTHASTSSFSVFPNDLNYGNTLFGGKLLAEIDCEASKVARSVIYGTEADNIVTASFEKVDFIRPAYQGDLIIMEADIISAGRTSMCIEVNSYIKQGSDRDNWLKICTAKTNFVALKDRRPYPHGFKL